MMASSQTCLSTIYKATITRCSFPSSLAAAVGSPSLLGRNSRGFAGVRSTTSSSTSPINRKEIKEHDSNASITKRDASTTRKNAGDIPFYGLPRQPSPSNESNFSLFQTFGSGLLAWSQNNLSSVVAVAQSVTTSSSTNNNNNVSSLGSSSQQHISTVAQRLSLTVQNATTALCDPTRADAVAAVGELTGTVAMQQLLNEMKQDSEGRVILQQRPIVSKDTIPIQSLMDSVVTVNPSEFDDTTTFGQAYGAFLKRHGYDPDERDDVKYIANNSEEAYVMLRYRQCHDYWHALTDLPPTVLGELGLKWLELFQTGLPLCALSTTVGSLRLESLREQEILWTIYLPWARRQAQTLPHGKLLMIAYEQEFDTPLFELRQKIGIDPAPHVDV